MITEEVQKEKTNSTGLVFTKFFDEIVKDEIPFESGWRSYKRNEYNENSSEPYHNYVDLAAQLELEPCRVVKIHDKEIDVRIIVVGTLFGNVVLYDKYKGQRKFGTIAAHFRKDVPTMRYLINGVNISEHEIFKIIGNSYNLGKNIGFKIKNMSEDFKQ